MRGLFAAAQERSERCGNDRATEDDVPGAVTGGSCERYRAAAAADGKDADCRRGRCGTAIGTAGAKQQRTAQSRATPATPLSFKRRCDLGGSMRRSRGICRYPYLERSRSIYYI